MKLTLHRGMLLVILIQSMLMQAQSVAINDDASLPHPSAILDVKVAAASKKGILIPRMTSDQRTAIAAPAKGLMVFDNTTSSFWYYNGTAWTQIASGSSTNYWTAVANHIVNNNIGSVGIGVAAPKARFNVGENRTVLFGKDSTGTGKKFIWYPAKSALRFGEVDPLFSTTAFNYENVGVNSLAFGNSTIASGPQSIASGVATTASGFYSWAHGFGTFSTGDHSMAVGQNSGAAGSGSFSFGNGNRANGDYSQAFGLESSANGVGSAAFGISSIASAYNSFVIGQHNDFETPLSATNWNVYDPLFVAGNGQSYDMLSSAFAIMKNGVTGIGRKPVPNASSWGMLQVVSHAGKDHISLVNSSDERWGLYSGAFGLSLYFNTTIKGMFSASDGAYIPLSDRRLKTEIRPIGNVLAGVMKLKAYQYHFADNKPGDGFSHGFMAQDIQAVMPEFVSRIADKDGNEYLGVNYNKISVIAIKALQEQQEIINEQNSRIEALEKRLSALERARK